MPEVLDIESNVGSGYYTKLDNVPMTTIVTACRVSLMPTSPRGISWISGMSCIHMATSESGMSSAQFSAHEILLVQQFNCRHI